MKIGVVVVGPMDLANLGAADALLKCIEEFHGEVVQPILWAHDLGGVRETIKSRCLNRWAPATEEYEEDEEVEAAALDLVQYALLGELWRIPDRAKKQKGHEHDLLRIAASALITDWTPKALRLWEQLREAARHRNPTMAEVVAAFLLED